MTCPNVLVQHKTSNRMTCISEFLVNLLFIFARVTNYIWLHEQVGNTIHRILIMKSTRLKNLLEAAERST